MSCIVTSGIAAPNCADKFGVPGIQIAKVFIANFDQVTLTETVDGEISGVAFDYSYSGTYQIVFHDGTVNGTEELQTGDTAGSYYNQTFLGRTINTSTATRNAIEDMVDIPLLIIYKSKKGDYFVMGESGGIKLTGDVTTTGAKTGDETGTLLTFTGVNNGKIKKFFNTDAATTEALVDGYLI